MIGVRKTEERRKDRWVRSLDKEGNNIFYLRLVDKHHSVAVGWEIGLSPLIHFIPITWNYTRYGLIQADTHAISGNLAASPTPLSNSSHLLAYLVVFSFFFFSPKNCFFRLPIEFRQVFDSSLFLFLLFFL